MAIYHLSTKPVKRGDGRSAVAAAAYRSGGRLVDERTGLVHDYTRRRDYIERWIQAPDGAPAWTSDRAELWNRAEAAERRKDSRTAREVEVALPRELDDDRQRGLVEGFVRERFVERGMVADVAVHRGDHQNPHVHILLTTRPLDGEGFAAKKPDKEPGWIGTPRDVRELRAGWERHANRELERAGSLERISCLSYRERGMDRVPTVHEGPNVREMEARGLRTDRGERNREALRLNAEREHRGGGRLADRSAGEPPTVYGTGGEEEEMDADQKRRGTEELRRMQRDGERAAEAELERIREEERRRGRSVWEEIRRDERESEREGERQEKRQEETRREHEEAEREERRRLILEAREREARERERGEREAERER